MNSIHEILIEIGGPGGSTAYSRNAKMIQKLLKDAGVEDVIIEDVYPQFKHNKADDELKMFLGVKPSKVTIRVRHDPWGG